MNAPGPGLGSAFSYILARGGWPDLIPELTYTLTGIKDEITAISWLGAHVAHSFTADAYITSLELGSKLPDAAEILDLAEEGKYACMLAWYWDGTGKEGKVTAGDQTQPKRLAALYSSKSAVEKAVAVALKKLKAA